MGEAVYRVVKLRNLEDFKGEKSFESRGVEVIPEIPVASLNRKLLFLRKQESAGNFLQRQITFRPVFWAANCARMRLSRPRRASEPAIFYKYF